MKMIAKVSAREAQKLSGYYSVEVSNSYVYWALVPFKSMSTTAKSIYKPKYFINKNNKA